MEPFRFHLFVCTQQKPEGVACCAASGSLAVRDALDREIHSRGLDNDVQLTTCGCMGLCEEGPVMAVYPAGVWYRKVQPADVAEIVGTHLRDGKPVERLIWNDPAAMKTMSAEHRDRHRAAMVARDKAGMLPDRLEQMIRGYMQSRCMLTALELDIFTAVGDGANAGQIGTKIKANARAAGMLLNALVSLGLLSKSGGEYRNTPESARYFVRDSAPSLKDNHRDGLLHIANIWHNWSTLTEAVRSGTRVPVAAGGSPEWMRNFIAGMQHIAKDRAPLVVKAVGTNGVRRILDLGGGSGAYSIAFAKASADVRCEILDIPEVVPLTTEYVRRAGVSAQVSLRAGDMLADDFGSGYDLILLNAICHMFSEEQNRDLFRRAQRALAPKGRLVVQDFILDPEKTSPQWAALFSLNMLVGTDAGASYNEAEYTAWMKDAGFTEVNRINLPGPSDLIVGGVK
jgi:(2Fe-2S) ferredoxin/predicted O-methyltransferase YrrM